MTELFDMARLSIAERDSRWARVRQAMAARDLSCIITPPHTGHWEHFQADTRYLSHIGGNCSETACVFPLEGEVMAVALNRPEWWKRTQNWVTNVRTPVKNLWSLPIVEHITELGLAQQKIGVVGLANGVRNPEGIMPVGLYDLIRKGLPNATFEDCTVMMAEIRAIKSAEEMSCLEQAVDIVEEGIAEMARIAKPGLLDYELYAAVHAAMLRAGGEFPSMLLWGSGPDGHADDGFLPTRRRLEKGDLLVNEMEGKWQGYIAQRVQPAILGKAPAKLVDAMNRQRATFEVAREHFRPGVTLREVSAAVEGAAAAEKCQVRLNMQGRGLGEDRPFFMGAGAPPDVMNFTLQEGNVLIVKPLVELDDGTHAQWGDMLAVTSSGGRRLGKQPHELLEI